MQVTAFRQAALVLAKLDRSARDAVLDRMPSDKAMQIRDELLTLDDDDASVQSAVRSFLASRTGTNGATSTAELASFHATLGDKTRPNGNEYDGLSNSLRDLLAHSNQSIADSLAHERATTVGALLASMPGERAAGVLKLFPSSSRTRVLAILDAGIRVNATVVDVVSEWICDRLAESCVEPTMNVGQRDALRAILDEFNPIERQAMLTDLAEENPMLAERLAKESASETDPTYECFC